MLMANVKKPYDEATTIISVTIARRQLEELDTNYENRSVVIRDALDDYFEKNGSRKTIEDKISKFDNQILEIQNLKKIFVEKLNVFLAEDNKKEEYEKIRKTPEYEKAIEKLSVAWANVKNSSGGSFDEKNMIRMAKNLEDQIKVPYKTIYEDAKAKATKYYLMIKNANDSSLKRNAYMIYNEKTNQVLISS